MGVSVYHVDAFTAHPFHGNPAAVCLLHQPEDAAWMQSVAAEMNLSETAFLHPMSTGFGLRWFTPITEVDLCGHATLASAHILWETGILKPDEEALFSSRSGVLHARQSGEWIEITLPSSECIAGQSSPGLAAALGADPVSVQLCDWMMLVEVHDEETVRQMEPDYGLLLRLPAKAIAVTAPAHSPEYDFVSRFFAPHLGIPEDPVTGAAHCALGPYWEGRLGKSLLTAYQASKRGGVLKVRVEGERTYLSGQAVTVASGVII